MQYCEDESSVRTAVIKSGSCTSFTSIISFLPQTKLPPTLLIQGQDFKLPVKEKKKSLFIIPYIMLATEVSNYAKKSVYL